MVCILLLPFKSLLHSVYLLSCEAEVTNVLQSVQVSMGLHSLCLQQRRTPGILQILHHNAVHEHTLPGIPHSHLLIVHIHCNMFNFQAVHFIAYEQMMNWLNPSRDYVPEKHFVSGAVAGGVAATVTMPWDVAKTLLNTQEANVLTRLNTTKVVVNSFRDLLKQARKMGSDQTELEELGASAKVLLIRLYKHTCPDCGGQRDKPAEVCENRRGHPRKERGCN